MHCRCCGKNKLSLVLDLGFAPPSNAYLTTQDLNRPEIYYPLRIYVCHNCWLVQTEDYADRGELFTYEYAYFSSTSASWLAHAKAYCEKVTELLHLSSQSYVVELASNDGYLLRNFVEAGVPCLGIEPTAATAQAAQAIGVPVLQEFFGEELARKMASQKQQADLIVGNNVLAHVPDINDFTSGIKHLLSNDGVVTLEFPHLLELLRHNQFDTIYHEHFSYLSLTSVKHLMDRHGLKIWNVERLPTHGGSLRVYACHANNSRQPEVDVTELLDEETNFGLTSPIAYSHFSEKVADIKNAFIEFLLECKKKGLQVCGYGAAAKGNTLLNYAGIKPDMISFISDAALSKQNKFMPGSHIPIFSPGKIAELQPDIVIVFPWNIFDEVNDNLQYIKGWGGRLVVVVPELKII